MLHYFTFLYEKLHNLDKIQIFALCPRILHTFGLIEVLSILSTYNLTNAKMSCLNKQLIFYT